MNSKAPNPQVGFEKYNFGSMLMLIHVIWPILTSHDHELYNTWIIYKFYDLKEKKKKEKLIDNKTLESWSSDFKNCI